LQERDAEHETGHHQRRRRGGGENAGAWNNVAHNGDPSQGADYERDRSRQKRDLK
jgi:hypothetical protein